MNDDLLILRLAVQNSLIGCVTSELRALYVKIENKDILYSFIPNNSVLDYGLVTKNNFFNIGWLAIFSYLAVLILGFISIKGKINGCSKYCKRYDYYRQNRRIERNNNSNSNTY